MAEDELIVPIDQALWPKGVVRGLTPVLRSLGDKHGNLVIVAQSARGHIMVKGPKDKIEEAKPGLWAIIQEHFPDVDEMPEELGIGAAARIEREEPAAPPAPAKPAPAPAPPAAAAPKPAAAAPAPKAATAASKSAPSVPAKPVKPVAPRKGYFPTLEGASPDLLWACIRKSSCFARKPTSELKRPFSAEPTNLLGIHCQRYCGLIVSEALDVRAEKRGAKESIVLVRSSDQAEQKTQPAKYTTKSGLHKCPQRGLAQLERALDAKCYSKGLSRLASLKYLKVQQSFKKKHLQKARAQRAKKAAK